MSNLTRRALLSLLATSVAVVKRATAFTPLLGGGASPPIAPPASSIGTFTVVNNGGSTLTNQPLNLAMPTQQGVVNPATQHLAFDIGGVTVPSTTGFFGTWSDGSQATAMVALNVASLPVGQTLVNMTVQAGAASSTLPGGKTVAQIKTAILAHFDGLSGRPAGNDIIVHLRNFQTYQGTSQGSGHFQSKLSTVLSSADLSVTYQGPTYIEFRSRANFVTDVTGGAAHAFVQADWYFGAHLDTSGNVVAVRFGPKMFQGTTQGGVTQTAYWYDCTLEDGLSNILLNFKKTATFADANISGALINIPNHGFQNGDLIYFTSTGTLPTPLIAYPGGVFVTAFGAQTYSNTGGPNAVIVNDANHISVTNTLGTVQAAVEFANGTAITPYTGSSPGATHTITRTIYHDRCTAWRVVDLRGNWTWSQKAPVGGLINPVDIVHDRTYLMKGLVPPYDLTIGSTMANPDSPPVGANLDGIFNGMTWYKYVPGNGLTWTTANLDNTGDHGCIGYLPRWVSYYMQTGSTKWLDECRIMALAYDLFPRQFRDTTTRTVPNLTPTTIAGMTSEPLMSYLIGGNRNGVAFTYSIPLDGLNNPINRVYGYTRGQSDAGSHTGDFCSFSYWLEGDRGILDSALSQWQAFWAEMLRGVENANFSNQPFSMDKQINGVNYPCNSASYWGNFRQIGWNLRTLAHLLLSFPPSEVEYTYLKQLSANNAAYHAAHIAAQGPTFRTQGAFRTILAAVNGGDILDFFFHPYCWLGVYVINRSDPSANWQTVFDHISAMYKAIGGGGNPQISLFGGGAIDDLANSHNTTDAVNGWASATSDKWTNNAPFFIWSSVSPAGVLQAFQHVSMTFQNDGVTVAVDGLYDLSAPGGVVRRSNIEPLNANSRVKFTGGIFGNVDTSTSAPPTGILYNQPYRLININLTNKTANLSIDGVTPVTFTLSSNGVRPYCVWQYGGMGTFGDFNGGYAVIARAVYALAKADGLAGFDNGWNDFVANLQQVSNGTSPSTSYAANPVWLFKATR